VRGGQGDQFRGRAFLVESLRVLPPPDPIVERPRRRVSYPGTADVASELVRAKQKQLDLLEQKGTTCCYAKADKFWVRDADGLPWEMYTLLADAEAETAADPNLREFLGQTDATRARAATGCC
jgi:lactoylglutathione lyase